MFKGTNILEFVKHFDTKEKCLDYLGSYKWRKDFVCSKCSNISWSKTKSAHIPHTGADMQLCFVKLGICALKKL